MSRQKQRDKRQDTALGGSQPPEKGSAAQESREEAGEGDEALFAMAMELEGVETLSDGTPRVQRRKQRQRVGIVRAKKKQEEPKEQEQEWGPLARLSYARSGVSPRLVRSLKKGKQSLRGQLDLHGLRWKEAKQELDAFLSRYAQQGGCCVLVIHGKSHGAVLGKATMKTMVFRHLKAHAQVSAVVSALPQDGGLGAVYVWLS